MSYPARAEGLVNRISSPLIIPHRLPAFLESLMPLKNWCSIHARCSKSSLKHPTRFCDIFSKFKTEFFAYRSSKVSDCIFEIHHQWHSGFSREYFKCCCSCSFKPEIIKIGQWSHKMYSNNLLNVQESTIILNAYTKTSGNLSYARRVYIYIYIIPPHIHPFDMFMWKIFLHGKG